MITRLTGYSKCVTAIIRLEKERILLEHQTEDQVRNKENKDGDSLAERKKMENSL